MAAITRGRKQYFVEYESNKFNALAWNRETGSRGSYTHQAGNAGTIRSAKQIIRNIRNDYADEDPHSFRVYDSYADVEQETNHVPCVYAEE